MLPVSDNVNNNYNYPIYLTVVCKLAPVFVVKVSRPYFLTRQQGACEKLGLGTRLGHTPHYISWCVNYPLSEDATCLHLEWCWIQLPFMGVVNV